MDLEPVFTASRDKVKMTVRIDPYLKELFDDFRRKVGLSSCFLVENLIRGLVTGETVQVPRARPVTVNMRVNYGVTRPRRYPRPSPKEVHLWPPDCQEADQFLKSVREVGCLQRKAWIPLKKCWDCYIAEREVV